jgi:hypothetical protein
MRKQGHITNKIPLPTSKRGLFMVKDFFIPASKYSSNQYYHFHEKGLSKTYTGFKSCNFYILSLTPINWM